MIPLETLAANAIEASVLALVVASLSRILSLSAPLRSALWLLVLAKLLLPPIPILPAGLSGLCSAGRDAALSALEARPRAAPLLEDRFAMPEETETPLPCPPDAHAALLPESPAFGRAAGFPGPAPAEPPALVEATPALASADAPPAARGTPSPEAALTIIWLLGLLLFAWARARRLDSLRALIREARDADPRVDAECASLASKLEIRRPPRIRIVEAPISPFLWACGRPVIVLPAALVARGREDLLRTVLAHELAHMARGDHWTAWIEVATTLGYWWLPTAWLVSSAHERAADEAADALAAAVVSTPRAYARSLLSTIELIHITPLPAAFPGRSLGERDAVRRRLTMLFRCSPATRLSWTARLALIAIAALALPASPRSLSSQEAEDPPAADESVAAPSAAGDSGVGAPTAALPAPSADAPAIEPVTPVTVRAGSAAVSAMPGGPVTLTAPYERGVVTAAGGAPGDGDAIDVDLRLRRMEERIDALLRELQLIRSHMGPGASPARSPRAANGAPTGVRTSKPGEPATGAVRAYSTASRGASIRGTTSAAGSGLAPSAPTAPAPPPSPAAGMPGRAPAAGPSADWLPPPRGELTDAQRARIEELDNQYRARLEKHKERYAREREEAVRLILEGKDPNSPDTSPRGR